MKTSASVRSVVGFASFLFVLVGPVSVLARPRPPLPPLPPQPGSAPVLWQETFDEAYVSGMTSEAVSVPGYGILVQSWSGLALERAGAQVPPFIVPGVDISGRTNLAGGFTGGSVQFWFTPYWASASAGGTGPSLQARLLEFAAAGGGQSEPIWWLQTTAGGSALALLGAGGGGPVELLRSGIAWQAGGAHLVVLDYSPQGSALFLDGQLVAQGAGLPAIPSAAAAMALGSTLAGALAAGGAFDEVSTTARPQNEAEVSFYYRRMAPQAALSWISPAEDAQRAILFASQQATPSIPSQGSAASGSAMSTYGSPPSWMGCTSRLALQPWMDTNDWMFHLAMCPLPGERYDLLCATNLTPPVDWEWVKEVATNQAEVLVTNCSDPARFYQLAKIIDLDALQPTYYVAPHALPGADGSRDLPFPSLQAAFQGAANHAVIQVLPGTYTGPTNRNLTFGTNEFTLISERGVDSVLLDCGGGANRAFTFTGTNQHYDSLVVGLTISDAGGGAVYCNGSSPAFVNCLFTRNSAADGGGVFYCTNSSPVIVNCRFSTNTASTVGGAILARGSNSLLRVSHCSFGDNVRGNGGGTLCLTNGAMALIKNSIIWGARSDLGPEIVNNGGGVVRAAYCDIRGGFEGVGNLDADPQFEPGGSLRLTVNSPCIDQGTTNTLPGFRLVTRYDMDGEGRLDHNGFTNATASAADIGADEFVYRLRFPWGVDQNDPNGPAIFSVVDEASGVAYLGQVQTNGIIYNRFAIGDDELRTSFYLFDLDTATGAILTNCTQVGITNVSYTDSNDQEVHDIEGLAFDSTNRFLYLLTSQTKRNRYRGVDNLDSDPVVDPPANDYDRRRCMLIRVPFDANLNPGTNIWFWESENTVLPDSVGLPPSQIGYDATNGLLAYIRSKLTNQVFQAVTQYNVGVLIASNSVNKFGTPVNGSSYPAGTPIPYPASLGGPQPGMAGISLGTNRLTGTLTNASLQANTTYYYKVWAYDAQRNYSPGVVASATTDGTPRLFINEILGTGAGPDWVEVYNPAQRSLNMGYINDAVGQLQFNTRAGLAPIPTNSTIPARGYLRFIKSGTPESGEVVLGSSFGVDKDHDDIILENVAGTLRLDEYAFKREMTNDVTEGHAWDGGPRGYDANQGTCEGARFFTNSSFPPTGLRPYPPSTNHPAPFKHFFATPDPNQTSVYLEWQNIGVIPKVKDYSPKQHDNLAINVEDVAYRSTNEVIIGLRSPLANRSSGNALYFRVTNLTQFLPTGSRRWLIGQPPAGITGPQQLNLTNQGIRGLKWCPQLPLGPNPAGRYLIVSGPASGGPYQKEAASQLFSLWSWTGASNAAPAQLIADLRPYAIKPESADLIIVSNEWRVLFVEDRYRATGYATRNAVHWPVSILGQVP